MTAKMPRMERSDYPSLDMGHSFSRKDVSIVGLDVQVYGLEEVKESTKPIVGLVSIFHLFHLLLL
jgi:endo-1,4-beta-mannosidase